MFLDAGGVIVLPHRRLLAGALAEIGIDIDPDAVPRAHYRAVRTLDRPSTRQDYERALFPQLGIVPGRTAEAIAVWERLGDRTRSRHVLWSEPTPRAAETIAALRRAGLAVVIVTNSDGHGEENLRASGFEGIPVIDSTVVGAAKPDPRIFQIALERAGAGAAAAATVHVGDTLLNDVAGARAAGITPIHFDPLRLCRATDHRHVRTLAGLWRHVTSAPRRPPGARAGSPGGRAGPLDLHNPSPGPDPAGRDDLRTPDV
ncbi:MAG TPA: HAD family hydrolase [Solirubrobacteraceae bacterium]|nr:HAD family hydrolase [Solirubrobacteraceae bacterium]